MSSSSSSSSITRHQISRHNAKGGFWVALGSLVLDLENFQEQHPGGKMVLQKFIHPQEDALQAFLRAGHSTNAKKMILEQLKVGMLAPDEDGELASERRPVIKDDDNHNLHTGRTTSPPSWREFLVFLVHLTGTVFQFLCYWCLICNRDRGLPRIGGDVDTFQQFASEIWRIYFPTQLIYALGFLADVGLVQDCRDNFSRCQQAGFSTSYLLSCMSITFSMAGPMMGTVMWLFLQDSMPYFSWGLVLKVGAALLFSDMLFSRVHQWMHREQPHTFHALHHCCLRPTVTTNLIFDPQDFVLEFWASKCPIILILGTDLLGTYDGFACLMALALSTLIEMLGHDAWLRNTHYFHHVDVSTSYGQLHDLSFLFPTKADRKDQMHVLLEKLFETK